MPSCNYVWKKSQWSPWRCRSTAGMNLLIWMCWLEEWLQTCNFLYLKTNCVLLGGVWQAAQNAFFLLLLQFPHPYGRTSKDYGMLFKRCQLQIIQVFLREVNLTVVMEPFQTPIYVMQTPISFCSPHSKMTGKCAGSVTEAPRTPERIQWSLECFYK